jgi:excisionase family DNA binding protein
VRFFRSWLSLVERKGKMPTIRGKTEFLTLTQAAKRLRLSTHVIYTAFDEGRLTAYRFTDNGWLYFDPDDLDAFLDECRVGRSASLWEGSHERSEAS